MLEIQRDNFSNYDTVSSGFHHSRYRKAVHIHQFAELIYVLEGEITVITSGRRESAKKGDIAIINPFQPHGYFTEEGRTVKMWMLLFSSSLLLDLVRCNACISGYQSCIFTPSKHLASFIQARMFSTEEKKITLGEAQARSIKATLYPIYDEYAASTTGTSTQKDIQYDSIAAVIDYLGRHFKKNVTMSELSVAIGYSQSHISHSLAIALKMNFRELLNLFRVEYAKGLLIEKNATVFLVGLESGFGCERSFNRAFLKATGMTPRQYQQAQIKTKV